MCRFLTPSGASILDGNWHQIAASYDSSGGVALYIDGVAATTVIGVNGFSAGSVNTINVNNNAVTFGYEYGNTGGATDIAKMAGLFKGGLACASIWSRVLTASEVLSAYQGDCALSNTTGLLAEEFGELPNTGTATEPTTLALLGLGLAGLAAARRRKQ